MNSSDECDEHPRRLRGSLRTRGTPADTESSNGLRDHVTYRARYASLVSFRFLRQRGAVACRGISRANRAHRAASLCSRSLGMAGKDETGREPCDTKRQAGVEGSLLASRKLAPAL